MRTYTFNVTFRCYGKVYTQEMLFTAKDIAEAMRRARETPGFIRASFVSRSVLTTETSA